ncbi:hypothetical protein KZX50_20020 [Bacillus infantis]|uniref:hypothetical protein n=1 Tax=Bacillus infantis TaxID=324767 RepID=UPI0020049E0C|nr:hypothetical protein [Bacillus infantis]MCK6207731.1 hypothetical protein [Bacillus infantis]
MSRLHSISGCENTTRKADVIFVHGLGGDAFSTWRQGESSENFWPSWVGQDFPEVGVWSLGYAASSTKWARFQVRFSKGTRDSGYSMSIPDRARQVLDLLVQNDLGKRPILFICHSLGGLLVKQILRMSSDSSEGSTERTIFKNTRAVLFLGTPHHGAELASLVGYFRIAFPTLAIKDLKAHDAHLRDLFEWYREHGANGIQTRTYYEARGVRGALIIVNPTSAHPGVGAKPVPLDEDHISIAKPQDRNAQVYIAVMTLLKNYVLIPTTFFEYRKDIEVLSRFSRELKDDLGELSRLRVGQSEIRITRRCVQELRLQVENQSLMVVGEPGAGKSGVLHDLVASLMEEGRDTVYLAVDRIDAESKSELREQLELEHSLDEVLENWSGDQSAFLVIDALDAARSDRTAQMLTQLLARIVRTKGRWRVVASIRKFDLRHNRELRNLFYGRPPLDDYRDSELVRVCHIQVPIFSEEELSKVSGKSAQLKTLIDAADGTLKQLLRVPFNLRLMADLLGEGVSIEELTPIRTQVELFDRYWEDRVVHPHDGQRDAREEVLGRAVSQMVENRKLVVPRSLVVSSETSRAVDQILSGHVMVEWQPSSGSRPDDSNLTFSHHVLFDYAVERLLLRTGDEFSRNLASDPEMLFVIRPSLDMHFQHMWSLDISRSLFWELVLRVVEDPRIPEVGKLIGPVIAAESCTKLSDFDPLLQHIDNPLRNTSAEAAIRHMIGGLVAMAPTDKNRRVAGHAAGPWAEFVEYLSQKVSSDRAYLVRFLLLQLCEQSMDLTDEQLKKSGIAARNLLEFAWSQESRDEWLVRHAITCVCQTFHSNTEESSRLLRFALRKEHLEKYGFQEVPWLAYEVQNIIIYDCSFVRDLYIAAFGFIENSEEKTPMGGRILSLISNRRQDYHGGLYQLGENFGYFIEIAPFKAVEALIYVVEQHVLTKHNLTGDTIEDTFLFDGLEAIIHTDYSSIWDDNLHHRHEEPIKMMDTFQTYLTTLGMDKSKTELRQQLINLLIKHNRTAALWRRVLICGAEAPAFLGLELRFLGWSLPILKGYDTSRLAGDFLKAIYSYLSQEDREKVERVILSIPLSMDADFIEQGERIRDRLLASLPPDYVCSSEARHRISEIVISEGRTKNESDLSIGTFESREYSIRDYLADEGVPIDDVVNSRIQELESPVALFSSNFQNARPSLEDVREILPKLHELWKALSTAEADGIHPKQKEYGWGSLAEACASATKCTDLTCDEELSSFLVTVLREASQCPEPLSNPEVDDQFGENPHWGKPAPRIDAAEGLAELACFPSCATSELLAILEGLLNDSVPPVRYQVVVRLLRLYETNNDSMWRLIDRIVMEELNRGVLNGLVNCVLAPLAGRYPDRVTKLAQQIFNRTTPGMPLRNACMKIFRGLFLWQGHTGAGEMIQSIITNPLKFHTECHHLVAGLRENLKVDLEEFTKPNNLSVRKRTWTILQQLLLATKEQWKFLSALSQEQGGWSDELQKQLQPLAQTVDSAAMEVYLASGAFENKKSSKNLDSTSLNNDNQRLFFIEASEVLDLLADFSFASVTHHLLQTLEFILDVDPVGVFLRIGRTILAGQEGGYQYESMAADLVVNLVERYLAEYRGIFRDNPDCRRTLLELLDVFVQAGWPNARRLTYRMDEIFR